MSRASLRRSSSDFHWRSFSMSVTLERFLYLFLTYLAHRRWNISSLSVSPFSYGSQMVQVYSNEGRTSVIYACSLMAVDAMFRFLRMKLRFLLALLLMLLMCSPQSSFSFNVHPRYLVDLTCSKMWLWSLYWWMMVLRLRVIEMTWHFSGWNSIFHLFSHDASLFRSSCNFMQSVSPDMVRYAMVSSAKSRTVDLRPSGMSFM